MRRTTSTRSGESLWLFLGGRYRQVELELSRQFFLGVESVREVDTPDATVGVDLRAQTSDKQLKTHH